MIFIKTFSLVSIIIYVCSGCKSSHQTITSDCNEVEDIFYCEDSICANKYYGHIDTIYQQMPPDMYYDMDQTLIFPIVFKIHNTGQESVKVDSIDILHSLRILNQSFKPAAIQFKLRGVEYIYNTLNLQQLTANTYEAYPNFSTTHDAKEAVTIHVLDDNGDYCVEVDNTISCQRVHGFTYILSQQFANIVVSKPDLLNEKVLPHEMGHFFGLYHTHRAQEGEEQVMRSDCEITGDHLCSTPADPGPLYSVYIDYTRCEMIGLKDKYGHPYKPLINNYMSYYSPCYRRAFSFTEEQLIVMRTAALSGVRSPLLLPTVIN